MPSAVPSVSWFTLEKPNIHSAYASDNTSATYATTNSTHTNKGKPTYQWEVLFSWSFVSIFPKLSLISHSCHVLSENLRLILAVCKPGACACASVSLAVVTAPGSPCMLSSQDAAIDLKLTGQCPMASYQAIVQNSITLPTHTQEHTHTHTHTLTHTQTHSHACSHTQTHISSANQQSACECSQCHVLHVQTGELSMWVSHL